MTAVPLVATSLAAPAAAPAAPTHDPLERAVVRGINRERGKLGLRPLRASRPLARIASRHSADQLRHARLSHDAGDGTPFPVRLARVIRARRVGETVAWLAGASPGGPAGVVGLWLQSPPHRAQLLDPAFRRVGVGRRRGKLGALPGIVVTADFATRR